MQISSYSPVAKTGVSNVKFGARIPNLANFELARPKLWNFIKEKNSVGYDQIAVEYASRWAKRMEEFLAQGFKIPDIAMKTSFDVAKEMDDVGISGGMFHFAKDALSKVWKYGEELKNISY